MISIRTLTSLCSGLLLCGAIVAGTTGCRTTKGDAPVHYDTITTMTGLRYIDFQVGSGAEVKSGMKVKVDYAGYLTSGLLFDTSLDSVGQRHDEAGNPFPSNATQSERRLRFNRGGYPFQPLDFTVGAGQVIRGWDDGLTTNIRVGGWRRLIIPPDQGYGARGSGAIPPNATLIFDVHVIEAH